MVIEETVRRSAHRRQSVAADADGPALWNHSGATKLPRYRCSSAQVQAEDNTSTTSSCSLSSDLVGSKSVEVRAYPPPPELAGNKCWLLASDGEEGVATFGDMVDAGAEGGKLVGWVLFDGAVEYKDAAALAADFQSHRVPVDSPYSSFHQHDGQPLYGWRVVASHRAEEPLPLPAMRRIVRSVYQVL